MAADAQLRALAGALRIYDGVAADLRDRELHVTRWQPGGTRRTTVTCAPLPSDFDRLWFWNAERKPIGEAYQVTDAALAVAASLRPNP